MALTVEQKKLLERRMAVSGIEPETENHHTPPIHWQADRQNWHHPFPLTDVQYAYWLGRMSNFDLGQIGSHGYQEWYYQQLDVKRYEMAWNKLIARHGMLRAVIQADGLQRIMVDVPWFSIPCVDCRNSSESAIAQAREQLRQTLSHRCYDPTIWPGFTIHALLLPAGGVILHVSADALFGDVYSSLVLRRELKQLYDHPDQPLAELNFSFRDYVCWLKASEDSTVFKHAKAWWRQKVKQLPPAPTLPWLSSLPEAPHFQRLSLRLPAEQWQRLQNMGRSYGLSPSCLLLSVYSWILRIWSGEQHFTINMTLFNRVAVHPDVANLMGDFTQTLLFGCHLQSEDSFVQAACRIQQDFVADFEHRHYSGVRVLRDYVQAHTENQAAGTTTLMPVVFTSALGVEELDATLYEFGQLEFEITQTPQVLIDQQVFEQRGELVVQWDAVAEAFPDNVLNDMFNTLYQLLHVLADDVWAWNSTSPISLPEQQLQVRQAVNRTQQPYRAALLHEAAYQRWHEAPDVPAIYFAEQCWTRDQLWQWATRIAIRLRTDCVAGEFVAVLLARGPLQVAAVLGVMLAGCAYVPVDTDWPAQRCEKIITKAGVRRVLVDTRKSYSLAGVEKIIIDESLPAARPLSGELPGTVDAAAYAIFTSGSTGEPKGVVISHQAAWNTLADITRRFSINQQDKVLGVSSLSFDLSVFDIFAVLGVGGILVIPDRQHERDIEHWRELISKHGVTIWNSVPALMELLLAQPGDLGSLRLALLSGDWIVPAMVKYALQNLPAMRLISLGGATEAAIWSVYYPVTQLIESWKSIPYGTPLANQRLYVLDQQLNDVADWVAGDLYIGGDGLATGYLHDTERTEAAFIFDVRRNERLYYTGDRARYRPGGLLEFLGRADNQIKLGGYRIEPGDIEAAMLSCTGVSQALVLVTGSGRQRRLTGYACGTPDNDKLYRHLADCLPAYMIPVHIEWLDTLPLTANGKVDRQRLVAIENPIPQSHSPATTLSEQRLLALLSEELGYPVVDVETNLFDLGASSITVVNLHQRLVREWCADLSLMTLFQRTCLRDLAATLDGTAAADNINTLATERATTRIVHLRRRQQQRTQRN